MTALPLWWGAKSMDEHDEPRDRRERLTGALRRVVLLKETGPKSAAWHRARVKTIWRLHALLDQTDDPAPHDPPTEPQPRT